MEKKIILNSQSTDLTTWTKNTITELDDSCCLFNDIDMST